MRTGYELDWYRVDRRGICKSRYIDGLGLFAVDANGESCRIGPGLLSVGSDFQQVLTVLFDSKKFRCGAFAIKAHDAFFITDIV